jgi:hypothetical protein
VPLTSAALAGEWAPPAPRFFCPAIGCAASSIFFSGGQRAELKGNRPFFPHRLFEFFSAWGVKTQQRIFPSKKSPNNLEKSQKI